MKLSKGSKIGIGIALVFGLAHFAFGNKKMNKPMCAKCNKPVDEIKMESHSIGFVVAAICHDKADVVVVPWEYMAKGLDPSRISYTGKAFEGK